MGNSNTNGPNPTENIILGEGENKEPHATEVLPEGDAVATENDIPNAAQTNPPMGYAPYVKVEKPITPATGHDMVFAALAIICSILAVDWGVTGGFALGFTIVYALLFIITVAYLIRTKPKLSFFPILAGLFSLASAGVFTLNRDPAVDFVLFFVTAALYCIMISGLGENNRFPFGSYGILLDILRTAVFVPLAYFAEPFRSLSTAFKDKSRGKRFTQIIIGVALSLPVILIIVPLLVSADEVFGNVVSMVMGKFGEVVIKVLFGLALSPFLISLLFALNKRLDAKKVGAPESKTLVPRFDCVVFVTFLSVISVFYMVYLFSQLAYFCDAFKGMLPTEHANTLAEYARYGFFEMSAIAGINLLLLSVTLLFSNRKEDGKFAVSTKILCSFVGAFTLFIISTAFAKMVYYISEYGMTRLRILTSIFMGVLAIAVLALLIRVFIQKFPYMKAFIVCCMVLGLVISYVDIDTTIARYNVGAYQSGALKTVDVRTIGELGDASVPYLLKLINDKDQQVSDQAKWELKQKFTHYYSCQDIVLDDKGKVVSAKLKDIGENRFCSYNVTESRAKKLLHDNYISFIDASPYENSSYSVR